MSLLSYASPWTSDAPESGSSPSRKRVATMSNLRTLQSNAKTQSNVKTPSSTTARKTVKVRPNAADEYDIYKMDEDDDDQTLSARTVAKPNTIDDVLSKQTDTNTRINSILNKITSFSNDDRLGDFNPMPYPTTINRKNADQIMPAESAIENTDNNPLLPNTGFPKFERGGVPSNGLYARPSDGSEGGSYTNYREAYGREGLASIGGSGKEPYYSKMGIGKTGDKVMDRLNYMTQMLESMQMEKTNHVTEEFILYTLLGVFMIYIVDGFSRGGKYVR